MISKHRHNRKFTISAFTAFLIGSALQMSTAQAGGLSTDIGQVLPFPFSNTLINIHPQESFIDQINFSLPGNLIISSAATALDLSFSTGVGFHLNQLSVQIFDFSNTFIAGATSNTDPGHVALEIPLNAGQYHASIAGVANGSAGGIYNYTISSLPPVLVTPEAGTSVMFGLGLALSALWLRRKSGA